MHLIVFCHLRWDFVLQRPQQVIGRLAEHHEVLFVEEPMPCDGEPYLEVLAPTRHVQVLRPRTASASAGFAADQIEPIQAMLRHYLESRRIEEYAVWLYTPMAVPLLDALKPKAVVYDCMDELSAFKNAPVKLHELESKLLERADIVFTGGPSLYEAKRARHANVHCLPSAVDAHHYSRERALADVEGMERAALLQSGIGRPRLGFFGVIDERLDLGLVRQMALSKPEWQLVMVGPVVKISADELPRLDNIHWLGQQPYGLLAQLVATWDVCLLPFALNESTQFISPTKTLEYMAAEKPIVSTPVRDVAVLYGRHVRIASAAQPFIDACSAALAETPDQASTRSAAMLQTVAHHSWDATVSTMRNELGRTLSDGWVRQR